MNYPKTSSSELTHLKSRRDYGGFTQHLAPSSRPMANNVPTESESSRRLSAGFTIVELIIATAVFSTVLLASLLGFFQMGRLYYKGLTITQTQQTARGAVLNQLTADIQQAADGSVSGLNALQKSGNGYQRFYYCVGDSRYTVLAGRAVNLAENPNYYDNFGILKDSLPGTGSCAKPYKDEAGTDPQFSDGAIELLSDNMRVSRFSIEPSAYDERLFDVKIRLAYGHDDVLDLSDPDNPENIKCDTSANISEFCAVTELYTTVTRGLIKL